MRPTTLFSRNSNTRRKRRTARIAKAETDQARGIYFWAATVTRSGQDVQLQFSTHVTKHTPQWCNKHKRGYDLECC